MRLQPHVSVNRYYIVYALSHIALWHTIYIINHESHYLPDTNNIRVPSGIPIYGTHPHATILDIDFVWEGIVEMMVYRLYSSLTLLVHTTM